MHSRWLKTSHKVYGDSAMFCRSGDVLEHHPPLLQHLFHLSRSKDLGMLLKGFHKCVLTLHEMQLIKLNPCWMVLAVQLVTSRRTICSLIPEHYAWESMLLLIVAVAVSFYVLVCIASLCVRWSVGMLVLVCGSVRFFIRLSAMALAVLCVGCCLRFTKSFFRHLNIRVANVLFSMQNAWLKAWEAATYQVCLICWKMNQKVFFDKSTKNLLVQHQPASRRPANNCHILWKRFVVPQTSPAGLQTHPLGE